MVVRIGPGPEPGWLVAAVGIGMTVVGWYQISGQPTEAQQLPYLASATIPGSALIIAGAVMITARRMAGWTGRGGTDQYSRYDTVRYPVPEHDETPTTRKPADERLWALPGGNYVHRADCPLIDGKPEAFEITEQAAAEGSAPQRPCPICDPHLRTLARGVSPTSSDTVTLTEQAPEQRKSTSEALPRDTVTLSAGRAKGADEAIVAETVTSETPGSDRVEGEREAHGSDTVAFGAEGPERTGREPKGSESDTDALELEEPERGGGKPKGRGSDTVGSGDAESSELG